jgi:hypothetical protein
MKPETVEAHANTVITTDAVYVNYHDPEFIPLIDELQKYSDVIGGLMIRGAVMLDGRIDPANVVVVTDLEVIKRGRQTYVQTSGENKVQMRQTWLQRFGQEMSRII